MKCTIISVIYSNKFHLKNKQNRFFTIQLHLSREPPHGVGEGVTWWRRGRKEMSSSTTQAFKHCTNLCCGLSSVELFFLDCWQTLQEAQYPLFCFWNKLNWQSSFDSLWAEHVRINHGCLLWEQLQVLVGCWPGIRGNNSSKELDFSTWGWEQLSVESSKSWEDLVPEIGRSFSKEPFHKVSKSVSW